MNSDSNIDVEIVATLDSINDEYMRRKEEEKRAILERMKNSNDSLDEALSSYNEIGRGR